MNPTTKEVWRRIKERINEASDILSVNAGLQVLDDRYMAGMIRAYREILDLTHDEDDVVDNIVAQEINT
jgi:hypothetical protein